MVHLVLILPQRKFILSENLEFREKSFINININVIYLPTIPIHKYQMNKLYFKILIY